MTNVNDKGTTEVGYYTTPVEHPIKNPESYKAECYDIITAMDMPWELANAFKGCWRIASFYCGVSKSSYNPLRDIAKAKTYLDLLERRLNNDKLHESS